MKQILQSLKNGRTKISDIPMPQVKPGHLLIQTTKSLISPGTEKMLVAFGEASLLEKARQQPDKVRMVMSKIKTDGLLPTLTAVRHKLDQLIPMGYSNVGKVIAVGRGVSEFMVGDRVVSNGAHAEIVCVAKNLCCKIPDSVADDDAAFAILGAIALQGIRLAEPAMGEAFAVIGLGLIGLLTVQLLRAGGCRVLGIDLDAEKTTLAQTFGAETVNLSSGADAIQIAQQFSRDRGCDGVIITCATKSNVPVQQAAKMCRKRGRIILVGVAGLQLSRADFYEKELRFQVSCAYGPGRYDHRYEQQGQDYPLGYVRFTAQRNFEAFLDLLAVRTIRVAPLITQRYEIENAHCAYESLTHEENSNSKEKIIGIMLDYPITDQQDYTRTINLTAEATTAYKIHSSSIPPQNSLSCRVGFIGAGNYASRVLIPAFKKTTATCSMIACANGISGAETAKRFHIATVTTDTQTLISDEHINTVVIATRHDNHADFVLQALAADKNVFVEKPLCMTLLELTEIENALKKSSKLLMVGFNRRFSPHIEKIKTLLQNCQQPKSFIMTVNAGHVPANHWTQDANVGGGRIIGEVCHFIDLLRYLVDTPIANFHLTCMNEIAIKSDKISISLTFTDGSFGIIHYLANGHASFPKERLEVFAGGGVLQLDNFRKLRAFGWPGFKRMHLWRQDKGQQSCARAFVRAVENGLASPIPAEEIIEVARITIEIAESIT